MAGILKISDASFWSAAGWMYDDVLEKMASRLSHENSDVRKLLLDNRTGVSVGYCDLRLLNSDQFSKIIEAANAVYLKTASDGPKAFAEPEFYPGYVKHFGILLDKLKSDPRAA